MSHHAGTERTFARWTAVITLVALLVAGIARPSAVGAAASSDHPVPLAPTHVHATADRGAAVVSWAAPPDNGSLITSYTVAAYLATSSTVIATKTVGGSTTTVKMTGKGGAPFQDGQTYVFTVAAANANGPSPESKPSNPMTPILGVTAPDPPMVVHASAHGDAVTVAWLAPYSGGSSITGYEVDVYQNGALSSWMGVAPANTSAVLNLAGGTAYMFVVEALNATGWSAPSQPSSSIVAGLWAPAQPAQVSARPLAGAASVSWAAPYDNGSPIVDYAIIGYFGASSSVAEVMHVDSVRTDAVVKGLTDGTAYSFTVVAINAGGWSPESARTALITPGAHVPDAPSTVRARAGANEATVSWATPFDGNSPITSYIVTAYQGWSSYVVATQTVDESETSARLQRADHPLLVDGQTYTFTVIAVNALGQSPESARSNPVVPSATLPNRPANVTATASGGSATVSWTAPFDGGSPITGYVVRAYRANSGILAAALDVSANETQAVVANLTLGGTFAFTVAAVNAVGQGPESVASSWVSVAALPGAPRNLVATAGDSSAQLRWDAPASDGGSPITGYVVTATDGVHAPLTLATTATSATLTGLTNNVSYTVSVVSVSAVGKSVAVHASVTPANRPPSLALPGDQSVKYGDATTFTISASDLDGGDRLQLSASGLPAGLTFSDRGNGSGIVYGTDEAAPGAYTLTFSVSDGHNPAVSAVLTMTVRRQDASITASPSTLSVLKIKSPNSTRLVTLKAMINSGSHGDLSNASPVIVTLTSLDSGATRSVTASTSENDSASSLRARATVRLGPGVYSVQFAIGGSYYEGSTTSMLAIYKATQGSIRAEGTLTPNGVEGAVKAQASYRSNGHLKGSLQYIEHRSSGDVTLRSTSIQGLLIKGHRAYLAGRATIDGVPGYGFVATIDRAAGGKLGLWVADAEGPVSDLTFAPVAFGSGAVTIRK